MQDSHHPVAANTLYLLTAAYFAWLLFVLLIFGFTPTNDGAGYAELARRCLSEGQPYPTVTTYAQEPFIWNIGIINLLELSLWLTGSQWPVLLLLCAMKAAIALLLSLIARRLFGSRHGDVGERGGRRLADRRQLGRRQRARERQLHRRRLHHGGAGRRRDGLAQLRLYRRRRDG